MSSSELHEEDSHASRAEAPSKSVNLWVIYGLVALALAAAIGCALLIVLPFYHRR